MKVLSKKYIYKRIIIKPYYKLEEYTKIIAKIIMNKRIDNQKLLRFELQGDGGKDLYGQFKSYPFIIQCKNHKNLIHAGEITKLEGTLTREKDGTIRIIIAPKFTSRAVIKSNNSKFKILCATDLNEAVELLKDKINNEIEIQ